MQAANHTIPPEYFPYVTGNFLSAALDDRKLKCSVHRIRNTKTFATRFVKISQDRNDGVPRDCMVMIVDYQAKEETSVLNYSAPPITTHVSPEECIDIIEAIEALKRDGAITEELANFCRATFGFINEFWETRGEPEDIATKSLYGIVKRTDATQPNLSITSKTSADLIRCRSSLERPHDQFAGLAFMLDGGIASIPLSHSGICLQDAGPNSSMDFSLRFFKSNFEPQKWHLRELKTVAGGEGRTYSEARVWDQNGEIVAGMTQQCILRPLKSARSSL